MSFVLKATNAASPNSASGDLVLLLLLFAGGGG